MKWSQYHQLSQLYAMEWKDSKSIFGSASDTQKVVQPYNSQRDCPETKACRELLAKTTILHLKLLDVLTVTADTKLTDMATYMHWSFYETTAAVMQTADCFLKMEANGTLKLYSIVSQKLADCTSQDNDLTLSTAKWHSLSMKQLILLHLHLDNLQIHICV